MYRWHAFTQMVLLRFRDFYREPEIIFWAYGFPLLLTVGLGIAFAGSRPEPPTVDVQGEMSDSRVRALAETLRQAGMKVEVSSKAESRRRYRTGKIALVIVPEGEGANQGSWDEGLLFVLDETRSESAWPGSGWRRCCCAIGWEVPPCRCGKSSSRSQAAATSISSSRD